MENLASNSSTSNQYLALLALQRIDGIGSAALNRLGDLANPVSWLQEPENRQFFSQQLKPDVRRKVTSFLRCPELSPEWEQACRTLEWLKAQGSSIWLKSDKCFPKRLLELYDCPSLLFHRGNNHALNKPSLSIVGARKPSHVGARFARELAEGLSSTGFTIVSGMASGIDTQAHRGALNQAGATVAVWATGLDVPYPWENQGLVEEIIANGCVLTEMPLGSPPVAGAFPRRNRIVAGLSEGVIVVEAGEKSGSMITARLAMEQNREVFAVPGAVNNPKSRGCHQLLREGACLVASVDDVIDNLSGFVSRALISRQDEGQSSKSQAPELSAELEEVFDAISEVLEPYELILARSRLDPGVLVSALVDLELMGLIVADAGCYAKA